MPRGSGAFDTGATVVNSRVKWMLCNFHQVCSEGYN